MFNIFEKGVAVINKYISTTTITNMTKKITKSIAITCTF